MTQTITNGTRSITATLVDDSTTRLEGTGVGERPLHLDREVAARTLHARIQYMGWWRQ